MEATAWTAIGVGSAIVIPVLTLAYRVGSLVTELRSQDVTLRNQGEALVTHSKILQDQTKIITEVATEVKGLCQRQDRVEKCLNGNLKGMGS